MNPHVYQRMDMIADHYHYDTAGGWTNSRSGKANDLGGGHAHIGMMIYQADTWPSQYKHKLFTINMHGQRVNVERLERNGAGYVARHEPDMFMAADPFFRGLELSVAPDGNVFLVDWSDTGECHEHNGVHRTSGRIYRISHGPKPSPRPIVKPECLRGDGPLQRLWRDYQAGKTTPDQLRSLLHDPDEHVRVWAIRLLTDFWPLDTVVGPRPSAVCPDDQPTRSELVRMAAQDESGLVHLTLASCLQRLPVSQRAPLAAPLLARGQHAQDRDFPLLVWFGLIPLAEASPQALCDLVQRSQLPLVNQFAARFLSSRLDREPEWLDRLLELAAQSPPEFQRSVLLGMQEGLRGWRKAPMPRHWKEFSATPGAQGLPEAVRDLSTLFGDGHALEELRRIAQDSKADMKMRVAALKSLIESRPADLRAICEALLDTRTLNAVAARGLALHDDPQTAQRLARSYRKFHPDDRPGLMEILVSRPSFASALMNEIGTESGRLPPSEISAVTARQIRYLGEDGLNKKLAQVWGQLRDSPTDRLERMRALKQQLHPEALKQADLSAGRKLFQKTCAQCHTLFGAGEKIGPDLTGSQRSHLDYLLENILDPSAVVGKDYHTTTLVTSDGRVLSGLLASRNDQTTVLQTATTRETIPNIEISQTRQTPQSPMPDGLLDHLQAAQVRDLIAYLMHPSQVP
jgi:putative heme-binding domain-containing protein